MMIGLTGILSVISAVTFFPPVHPIDRRTLRNNRDPGIVFPPSSLDSKKAFALTGLVVVSFTTFFGDWGLSEP